MNARRFKLILCALLLMGRAGFAEAQIVSRDDAGRVATNWITMIIGLKGDWGGAPSASITDVIDIRRGDRLVGYYCPVSPSGHISVSLVEGLAPVKEFSETDEFDLSIDEGPADLLKIQLEGPLDDIERQLGPIAQVDAAALDKILELNHRPSWYELKMDPAVFPDASSVLRNKENYQQSQVLLTSYWHQNDPYNRLVPAASNGCTQVRCTVGCVALAGAQIFRYWSWPPGRAWIDMPDTLQASDPQVQIDAVAELCSSIGLAVGMSYCSDACASSAETAAMEVVYEGSFYHSGCSVFNRVDQTWQGWYALIMVECSQNRPIHYRVLGHSIVCDGYWNLPTPLYHMNYGWASSHNDWYTLDQLLQPTPGGSISDEYMLVNIRPNLSLGSSFSGIKFDYPYYADQDSWGYSANWPSGGALQFLPRVKLACAEGFIQFDGSPGHEMWLYSVINNRGVHVIDGAMKFGPGGGIKFATVPRP